VSSAPAGGAEAYWRRTQEILEQVHREAWRAVVLAGAWVAESLGSGRRVLAFGTGHSHLLAEEFYARAGGLAAIEAVLEPGLMLHAATARASWP
jgi:uncharacterized phosphosugar-binding protein